MTVVSLADARRIAEEEVEKALSMSGVTHPPTQQRMDLAYIILDMITRVETLQKALDERPFVPVPMPEVHVADPAPVPVPKRRSKHA